MSILSCLLKTFILNCFNWITLRFLLVSFIVSLLQCFLLDIKDFCKVLLYKKGNILNMQRTTFDAIFVVSCLIGKYSINKRNIFRPVHVLVRAKLLGKCEGNWFIVDFCVQECIGLSEMCLILPFERVSKGSVAD